MSVKSKRKIITEPFVQKHIRSFLFSYGYGLTKDLENTELHIKGVDVKMKNRKYGRYFLVEAKGDPGEKVKSIGGSRSSALNSALGQIITRMRRNGKSGYKYGYKYGVAFPESYKELLIHKVPFDVFNKLNLYAFFVSHTGQVEMCDWRGIRDQQMVKVRRN